MRKYFINSVSIIAIVLLMTSCSNKIYFTNEMRMKLNEYDLEINKVQFYTSDKIVFKKMMPYDSAAIANGAIRFEKGEMINSVIIKKNTPGTCEFVENGLMNMAFETGENKYLIFNTDVSGKYYQLFINQDLRSYGEIIYDGENYLIQPGSEKAKLLVKRDQEYIRKIQERVVKGRKVN